MERTAARPFLVVNPSDDEVFLDYAQVLINHGVTSTSELERRLRPLYARAVVHARELSSEQVVIWYVYRDGRWVNARRHGHESGARADDVKSPG
jgi:hypothetical protein